MEVVLDLYSSVHCEDEPLINMDEASVQLQGHLYEAIAMQPGLDKKEDYHYTREGVQALFMFFDPNRGWRRSRLLTRRHPRLGRRSASIIGCRLSQSSKSQASL